MNLNVIQIIEGSALTTAAVCSVLAPGLEKLGHPIASITTASIGAGAIAVKAWLSTSPKDSNPS